LAGREVRRLEREKREEVSGLGNRIGRNSPEVIGAILAVLFLSVIRDTRAMRQQVIHVHLTGDSGIPQPQEINDRGIKRE